MKTLIRLLAFSLFAAAPLATVGCKTTPSERVVAAQTIKSIGQAAESAVAVSAQLYRDRRITSIQARGIAEFYDRSFQPAFRLAVTAARSDLSAIASPDLVSLATQLATLVADLQRP